MPPENLIKLPLLMIFTLIVVFNGAAIAQHRRPSPIVKARPTAIGPKETGSCGRDRRNTFRPARNPSLFSDSIQRMRRGRQIQILGSTEADGVKFFRVAAPRANFGWVQSDAVFGRFRASDEERLARLVQASTGFDQLEFALEFFKLYPDSKFGAPVLLLFGDLLEEVAAKLTKDAGNKLKRPEMAATGAPLHSYYLNYVSLDRYRKLGITFLFNSSAMTFHYDGTSWKQVIKKFPASSEAAEAQKRLDSLKSKMEKPTAATQ